MRLRFITRGSIPTNTTLMYFKCYNKENKFAEDRRSNHGPEREVSQVFEFLQRRLNYPEQELVLNVSVHKLRTSVTEELFRSSAGEMYPEKCV